MVLESKDPEKPLVVIDDKAYVGSEIIKERDSRGSLALAPFINHSSKGNVSLVVDYAATRPDQKGGEALIGISMATIHAKHYRVKKHVSEYLERSVLHYCCF